MSRRTLRSFPGALLASVALLFSGCDFESAGSIYAPRNRCVSQSDCGVGACMEGICVSVESAPVELAINVASPSNVPVDEGFAYTLEGVVVDGSTLLALEVPAHARVHGRVTSSGLPVTAQVTAFRKDPTGLVLGLDVRSSRTATDLPFATDGQPDHYAIRVARDEDFIVYAEPVGLSDTTFPGAPQGLAPGTPLGVIFPPLLVSPFRASKIAPLASDVRLDLAYPPEIFSACTEQKREGCTLRGTVSLVDAMGQPVGLRAGEGFQIRAQSEDRAFAVSSQGTTDAAGHFEVRITPGVTSYQLVAEGLPGTGLPTVRIASSQLAFVGGEVTIALPAVEPVPYVALVESAAGEPLANATVSFTSTSITDAPVGLDLVVDASVVTSDGRSDGKAGKFTAQLWPGTYDVVITPSDPSEGSSLRTTLVVRRPPLGGSLLGQLFRVPAPVRISGRALSALGGTAPYVGLSAVPQSTYDFSRTLVEGMRAPAAMATADATGLFELEVDRARYDLLLTANPESGFGSVVLPGLDLQAGADIGELEIELPPPMLIRGSVTIAGEAPSFPEGLVLSAFVVLRSDGPIRLAPIGQFVTESDGTYRMLVAPR